MSFLESIHKDHNLYVFSNVLTYFVLAPFRYDWITSQLIIALFLKKQENFMRGSRKFCQRGSNWEKRFYWRGREDPNINLSGP